MAIKGVITLELQLKARNLVIGGVARVNRYVDIENIKYPDGTPYIPGSSLKGRLRMLIEHAFGITQHASPDSVRKLTSDIHTKLRHGEAENFTEELVKRLSERENKGVDVRKIVHHLAFFESLDGLGPTRLHFGDLVLDKSKPYSVEISARNLINRYTGVAQHPRLIERISGTFRGRLSILIAEPELEGLKEDTQKKIKERLKDLYEANGGLMLLQRGFYMLKLLGIGRGVSRGNGRVEEVEARIVKVYPPIKLEGPKYSAKEADHVELREGIEEMARRILEEKKDERKL